MDIFIADPEVQNVFILVIDVDPVGPEDPLGAVAERGANLPLVKGRFFSVLQFTINL
jgi:hypothetical protein